MAIDAVPALASAQPTQSSQPQSPISVDENGNIETSDPKLSLQRALVEQLFGDKTDKAASADGYVKQLEQRQAAASAPSQPDTVTISTEAVELAKKNRAEITIKNGDTQIKVVLEHQESLRVEKTQTRQTQQSKSSDPLVVDLSGTGISLTDVSAGQGVSFDINGDGKTETVSWTAPQSGLLALDRNNDGTINSGNELFGDQHGAVDGFAELAKFDGNNDGQITAGDSVYSKLGVWQDRNQNGVSDAGEVSSLKDLGIESISLSQTKSDSLISGNRVTGYSAYQTAGGTTGKVGEAWLNYLA
jgi:trimeric autotransporter adhesin